MEKRTQNFLLREDLTEEEVNARYRHAARDDDEDEGEGNLKTDLNARNARLPDAQKDPKVWSVKVANGTEKTVVMQLMCKWHSLATTPTPISITGAYWNEQALGYIFLEAYRATLPRCSRLITPRERWR
jgi:hypothetical protein